VDKIVLQAKKPRDMIAKDLRSPKYRMRVEVCKKRYNRNEEKNSLRKELVHG
jgi:hypothetical protein